MKYLGIAFVSEGIVIVLSLVGAVLFAIQYGHNDWVLMGFMFLAPIGYAVVELTRVPLAILVRTQPNYFLKLLFFIGILCASAVTTKSLSQLGEMMFRPRMMDVNKARHDYHEAMGKQNAFQGAYAARKEVLDQANKSLTSANEVAAKQVDALKDTGKVQMCPTTYTYRDRNGKTQRGTRTVPCPESAASKAIRGQMADQQGSVTAARLDVDQAQKNLQALGTAEEVDANVIATRKVYDDAIAHSQLHAFTGMFFAKDPADVTEGELFNFLRLFVFVPAICASLASTLLAMGSVTRIKPKKIAQVAAVKAARSGVPLTGGRYVLDPLHKVVVEKAIDSVVDGVKKPEPSPQATSNLKVA
ncbi:ATPase [Microvirga sp. 3-52]|uniref:ATPase n=1 Tax=Microvirga sp. 3-52 TaxID=2792425 RepID=UPI001BCDC977|nr:ATPase [Microvirga sp. 3-52]MBS7453836.1 ATPase [Microvirga sp. 3-52]